MKINRLLGDARILSNIQDFVIHKTTRKHTNLAEFSRTCLELINLSRSNRILDELSRTGPKFLN
ncbi:hypothetical protein V1477_008148 [Vespula maculifrons]|uniref:Uncharacterized protein n=1 Tax=Vespula maculifrons TaxID=7453 RepID=A0ABD2CC69_VESMC